MNTSKVVLITGASSGIGEATAKRFASKGFTVYAGARRAERMEALKGHGITVLTLDVTDDASCEQAITTIVERHGRLDVLVNNAGYGSHGAIEDVPLDEARRQFEVNLFGLARMTQLALPHMRAAGYGRIISTSSVGGKLAMPLGGWYHASKFALEGWSDSLRQEVAGFGIDVVVIEPGAIKSEWVDVALNNLDKRSAGTVYGPMAEKYTTAMRRLYDSDQPTPPSEVADVIVKAATADKPKARYSVGMFAKPSLVARAVLPDRMFDYVIGRTQM